MKKAIKLLSTSLLLSVTFSHISHGMDEEGGDGVPKPLSGEAARKATASKVVTASPKKTGRPQAPKPTPTEEPAVTPKSVSTSAPTTPAKEGTPKRVTSLPARVDSPSKTAKKSTPVRPDLNLKSYPDSGFAKSSIESYNGHWVPSWLSDTGEKVSKDPVKRLRIFDFLARMGRYDTKHADEIACAYVHLELMAGKDSNLWSKGMDSSVTSYAVEPKLSYIFNYAGTHGHLGVVLALSKQLTPTQIKKSEWKENLKNAILYAAYFNNTKVLDTLIRTHIKTVGYDTLFDALNETIHPDDSRRKTQDFPSFEAAEYLINFINNVKFGPDSLPIVKERLATTAHNYGIKNTSLQSANVGGSLHKKGNKLAGLMTQSVRAVDAKISH